MWAPCSAGGTVGTCRGFGAGRGRRAWVRQGCGAARCPSGHCPLSCVSVPGFDGLPLRSIDFAWIMVGPPRPSCGDAAARVLPPEPHSRIFNWTFAFCPPFAEHSPHTWGRSLFLRRCSWVCGPRCSHSLGGGLVILQMVPACVEGSGPPLRGAAGQPFLICGAVPALC